MVIEFLGLPGSGKSTVSRMLAERLTKINLSVIEATYVRDHRLGTPRRMGEKLFFFLRYLLAKPLRSASIVFCVTQTKQKTISDWTKSLVNVLYVSAIYLKSIRNGNVLLLDQGIAQALWSIGFAARQDRWDEIVSLNWASTAWPDLVVVIRASPELVCNRLRSRLQRTSRMQANIFSHTNVMRQNIACLDKVVLMLRRHNVEIIEIKNDDMEVLTVDIDSVVATVARNLSWRGAAE